MSDQRLHVRMLGVLPASVTSMPSWDSALGTCVKALYRVTQEAECKADCFGSPRRCPIGVGQPNFEAHRALGESLQPCSQRGVCIAASATCSCHVGYAGAACEMCSVGFTQMGVPLHAVCSCSPDSKLNELVLCSLAGFDDMLNLPWSSFACP
jgi:hypothetical protein